MTNGVRDAPPKDPSMIVSVCAKLKEIYEQGRKYLWPKPKSCPRCHGSRLWGHGYVPAYFDDFVKALLLRRYRCPDCACVVRLKPEGIWKRFRASIETIRSCIRHRVETGQYLASLSRTRQGHWLRALMRKANAYLGQTLPRDLAQAFERLTEMGKIPVSRSI
jgi:hypothetical protein